MEKIKSLNIYQKCILILMIIMPLVFTLIYYVTISKVGYEYKDAILVPSQENGSTIYSGKIQKSQARFIVGEDKSVLFQYGDITYGPYVAKEDPTAIPEDAEMKDRMTGVELRQGEETLFRGGVFESGNVMYLYNEDGTLDNFGFSYMDSDGIERDQNGNPIDSIVTPSAETLLELMNDPELTHKGDWYAWFGGVFICIVNAVSILFVDELFRWNLSFQIRNADRAEPSDWEITGRYIGWTVLSITALILFIVGLQ